MIKIHFDFTDGTEVSFVEGKALGDNFSTNCLDFFSFDTDAEDVVVVRKDGRRISRSNIQAHTSKRICEAHNIHRMLVAGAFEWL